MKTRTRKKKQSIKNKNTRTKNKKKEANNGPLRHAQSCDPRVVDHILDRGAVLRRLSQHPVQQMQTLSRGLDPWGDIRARDGLHGIVEGDFTIQDRIQQDAKGPDLCRLGTVFLALEDLGRGICMSRQML